MARKTFCFLLFICMGVCACTVRHNSLRSTLCAEIVANVRDSVLPFWMDYAVAPDGGFYGTVLRNGTPVVDAPRGGVLNARILWSFFSFFWWILKSLGKKGGKGLCSFTAGKNWRNT